MESIIEAKPTCASSCRRTRSKPLASRLAALVADREGARRQQPLGLQLLAAEAHHHHLAAEVRIAADVAQRPDRDRGVGRVDGDAAAVGVLETDHVVDVRIVRQQLGLDALDRELDDAGDALHRRRDGQDVARADRAVGVAEALEREAVERRRRGRLHRRDRQAFERARRRHVQQPLVHPAAGGDRLLRVADGDAVADDRLALADVGQRHLVPLRHAFAQRQTGGESGGEARAGLEPAGVGDDRDVVALVHADGVRRGGGLGHAWDWRRPPGAESRLATRGERDDARVLGAARPAQLEHAREQRSAERATKMMAALAPVEAGPAKRAALAATARHRCRTRPASPCRRASGAGSRRRREHAPLDQAFVHRDAELAGEVVVADARLAQRRLARPRAQAQRPGAKSHTHERFEQLRHIAAGQAEVAMSPWRSTATSPASSSLARWPLIVCLVTPAIPASSVAVSARSASSAVSTSARARSPIRPATRAMFGPSLMVRS